MEQDTSSAGTSRGATSPEDVWDAHTAAEFVSADVDATMATMTENPVVIHVPTMVGARGRDDVRRFYAEHFIGHQPPDLALDVLSRTTTASRVVDELLISFTHTCEVPWILPGVMPTGRAVRVVLVVVISIVDGLVDSEHIYWDQASVLVQLGLLDPAGAPVSGAAQAELVRGEPTTSFRDLRPRAFPNGLI
jgi:carboxymethylenebutenolidase